MSAAQLAARGPRGDIWARVDLRGFSFSPRVACFDWKLLHGIDADDVVRRGVPVNAMGGRGSAALRALAGARPRLHCTACAGAHQQVVMQNPRRRAVATPARSRAR